jgi:hypothetical protein
VSKAIASSHFDGRRMALAPARLRLSRRRNVVDGKADPNGSEPQVTHGHWWIKNHRLCETVYLQGEGLRDNGCEPINNLLPARLFLVVCTT